ncbi:hypothetical protein FQN54_007951 [Arachnomyces sp. PD_36]|nr:hypothetical protein FQN54_007951 [Arachnomyces sp. PD_36]
MFQFYNNMNRLISFLLCIAVANADYLIESASFAQGNGISADAKHIPGWHLSGENYRPQLLSDRVILTPPYPGNTRGALWTENRIAETEWVVDFEFRASGPGRGGGNLQLWYANEGRSGIGSSSIYTVGKFDGFVLVMDTHGGGGGSIRGFLNDGTTEYKTHSNVDSLAFGHCDYAYRNLGRASHIRIRQTSTNFEVLVDQKPCFQTDKVTLPSNNYFGLTAATAEKPDSFEVFEFMLKGTDSSGQSNTQSQDQQQEQQEQQQQQEVKRDNPPPVNNNQGSGTTQSSQLAAFEDRLQKIDSTVNSISGDLTTLAQKNVQRHQEYIRGSITKGQFNDMDARLQRIESALSDIRKDLEGRDYSKQFSQLQRQLQTSHSNLADNLQSTLMTTITSSSPRMGLFIFLVVASQLLLAGGYVVYKRRRANMPKKFV